MEVDAETALPWSTDLSTNLYILVENLPRTSQNTASPQPTTSRTTPGSRRAALMQTPLDIIPVLVVL
ncbi:unnamed protein product [Euphydryas editha]|uniref:Uncharacterized protein n=1 Tax=Euphydryas editha TaxID=104508 RepID=A0AAU9U1F5_EUPED|nr:unnamed protein product [Euphydryas editha]